ncbi:MAG: glutamine synthetase, partial [Rubrivivax sp.]
DSAPGHPQDPQDARQVLSDSGAHWLAGLLAHADGMAALCVPTTPGYQRFNGSVMAPCAPVWGFDNRGAMLRVLGTPGSAATRIENRLPEPMANPYLALAAQIAAGLDGLQRCLEPGPPTDDPYAAMVQTPTTGSAAAAPRLPASLSDALTALTADKVLQAMLGPSMAAVYDAVRRQELARHAAAPDAAAWEAREYFGRF